MPPKPTCKVVKREGQKGARIAPKGCVVRAATPKINTDRTARARSLPREKDEHSQRQHALVGALVSVWLGARRSLATNLGHQSS